MGWWVAIVGGMVLLWSVVLDVRYQTGERLARWWVARARRHRRWAGLHAFLTSAAALAGYLALAGGGAIVANVTDENRAALVIVLPAMFVYAPFVFETMPSRGSAYRQWRDALGSAGASQRLARTIAWWAGPPSLAGMVSMIVTLFPIFDP